MLKIVIPLQIISTTFYNFLQRSSSFHRRCSKQYKIEAGNKCWRTIRIMEVNIFTYLQWDCPELCCHLV